MIPAQIRSTAARARRGVVFAFALAACALAACSSDPSSTLGSDDDLIASRPGVISQDTLAVFADTVLSYNSVIGFGPMDLGIVSGYERAMVLQFPFTIGRQDEVVQAVLRLTPEEIDGSIPARFYQLTFPYEAGDSIPALDTLSVIPDPVTGAATRHLKVVPREYKLPPSLVEGWLRRTTDRNAIAVVYADPDTTAIATFFSGEADSSGNRPLIRVSFLNGDQQTYKIGADANFIRPTTSNANLTISDGFVRRVYFRIPIDQLPERSAVQNARVRLYLVPGSTLGSDPNLVVYVPTSADPASTDFLSGQNVTTVTYLPSSDYIEFAMTNAIALILNGTLEDTGVVIRYDAENSSLRQVQFYGSNAPANLRPRIFITSSTPADYHPPVTP